MKNKTFWAIPYKKIIGFFKFKKALKKQCCVDRNKFEELTGMKITRPTRIKIVGYVIEKEYGKKIKQLQKEKTKLLDDPYYYRIEQLRHIIGRKRFQKMLHDNNKGNNRLLGIQKIIEGNKVPREK